MIRKTLVTALALAVIAGPALTLSASPSAAGGKHHGKHFKGHHHIKIHKHRHGHGFSYGYHPGHCFFKKVKVHGHYGWHWKRIKICY